MKKDNKSSDGKRRLAVGVSIIWVALLYFLIEKEENVRLFLLFGVLPVMIGWTLLWIRKGFMRDDKSRKKGVWPW